MASLEFEGYALIWWEQLLHDREEYGEDPIITWQEMKREMRIRFVPKHYRHDLFDKLQNLRQGSCWGLVLKCYELRTRQHRKC